MVDLYYRPTRAEISLDALHSNLSAFRRILPSHVGIMAVVKANAYGHGAVEIAEEAERFGAQYLGVAFLDEAVELRQAGIQAPILVLGYTPPEGIELAAQLGITLTVFSDEVLQAIARRTRTGDNPPLKAHIKVDTGMGRLGLHREHEAIAFIETALATHGLEVEGLFTHYACADEQDKTYTNEQHLKFTAVVNHFRERDILFPWLHAGNSATAIDCPDLSYNMIRLGIGMYGLYPSEEVNRHIVSLEPVMTLKTGVVMAKNVPPGTAISYGATYTTEREEHIATLPIGYADGYTRMLTGKASVLVKGKRAKVVGNICMDQCMVNVTDIPDTAIGDEVVLFGRQGNERITADELANLLGTINYEIPCMISNRVPRVYVRGDKIVRTVNPLIARGD